MSHYKYDKTTVGKLDRILVSLKEEASTILPIESLCLKLGLDQAREQDVALVRELVEILNQRNFISYSELGNPRLTLEGSHFIQSGGYNRDSLDFWSKIEKIEEQLLEQKKFHKSSTKRNRYHIIFIIVSLILSIISLILNITKVG